MTASLPEHLVIRYDTQTRVLSTAQQMTIGRSADADINIESGLVSRRHVTVRWEHGWLLEDLASLNGTWHEGFRVRQLQLVRRAEVRLGDPVKGTLIVLEPLQAPPPPPQTPNPRQPESRAVDEPSTEQGPADLLTGISTIGRAADCHLRIDDVLVSRHHARLIRGPSGVTIEDIGSANGTYVNGIHTKKTQLRERDVVTFGNSDFVFIGGALTVRARTSTETGLTLVSVGFTVEKNKRLLSGVSMTARPGSLTAIIGPSGAGKSTLARIISGTASPTSGVVNFQGHDLHAEYAALRNRIGLVPQEDVLHRQLTVRQALSYAAELRLPPDAPAAERTRVVDSVLAELSMTEHAASRVDKLSGGQRKRASVALELLTSPSLLILDEPTSGLDPALDRQVMVMLRDLADLGRVVLVITHSLTYLDMCDQVLLLAPGGKPAYCGRPDGVDEVSGTKDWAEIFTTVAADPEGVAAAYAQRHPQPPTPPTSTAGPAEGPPPAKPLRQVSTLVRRQVRLVLADRGYLAFLVAMPFILGGLALVVPGESGFGVADPNELAEPRSILALLILGACFMGTALTARDLVGERSIFLRERAVGLRAGTYLSSKVAVFCLVTTVQTAVLTAIMLSVKPGPADATTLGSPELELWVAIALTAWCCVALGLFLSALAKTADQVMPLLVMSIFAQLVMSGGLIAVTNRPVLTQMSWIFPSRWGFSAGSATVDMSALSPANKDDRLWQHDTQTWLFDILILVVMTAVIFWVTFRKLRFKEGRPQQ